MQSDNLTEQSSGISADAPLAPASLAPASKARIVMACIAALVLPGLGHLVLGRWARGVVIGLTIAALFVLGFLMQGHLFIPEPNERVIWGVYVVALGLVAIGFLAGRRLETLPKSMVVPGLAALLLFGVWMQMNLFTLEFEERIFHIVFVIILLFSGLKYLNARQLLSDSSGRGADRASKKSKKPAGGGKKPLKKAIESLSSLYQRISRPVLAMFAGIRRLLLSFRPFQFLAHKLASYREAERLKLEERKAREPKEEPQPDAATLIRQVKSALSGLAIASLLLLSFDASLRAFGIYPFEKTVEWLNGFFSLLDIGIGLPYFVCLWLNFGFQVQPEQAAKVTFEYGNTFLCVAGALNALAAFDAYDIGVGRKE